MYREYYATDVLMYTHRSKSKVSSRSHLFKEDEEREEYFKRFMRIASKFEEYKRKGTDHEQVPYLLDLHVDNRHRSPSCTPIYSKLI